MSGDHGSGVIPVYRDGTPVPEILTSRDLAKLFDIPTDGDPIKWLPKLRRARVHLGIYGTRVGKGLRFSRQAVIEAVDKAARRDRR